MRHSDLVGVTDTPINGANLLDCGFFKTSVSFMLELTEPELNERDSMGLEVEPSNGTDKDLWSIVFFRRDNGRPANRVILTYRAKTMDDVHGILQWLSLQKITPKPMPPLPKPPPFDNAQAEREGWSLVDKAIRTTRQNNAEGDSFGNDMAAHMWVLKQAQELGSEYHRLALLECGIEVETRDAFEKWNTAKGDTLLAAEADTWHYADGPKKMAWDAGVEYARRTVPLRLAPEEQPFTNSQANREGWALDRNHIIATFCGQREGKFANDLQAQLFVQDQAEKGSRYHQRALQHCGIFISFKSAQAAVGDTGPKQPLSFTGTQSFGSMAEDPRGSGTLLDLGVSKQKLKLWDEIHSYVIACGGNVGADSISTSRMAGLVRVEKALSDLRFINNPLNAEVQACIDRNGIHSHHPRFSRMDWHKEIHDGKTELGYWEWVNLGVETQAAATHAGQK